MAHGVRRRLRRRPRRQLIGNRRNLRLECPGPRTRVVAEWTAPPTDSALRNSPIRTVGDRNGRPTRGESEAPEIRAYDDRFGRLTRELRPCRARTTNDRQPLAGSADPRAGRSFW